MSRKWRNSKEWRETKNKVLIRDNFTCQICGSQKKLEVHHINDASYHPELRYDVGNCITLCHDCHMNFHNNFKRSYRQKCTKYDWDNFVTLSNYFKNKFK